MHVLQSVRYAARNLSYELWRHRVNIRVCGFDDESVSDRGHAEFTYTLCYAITRHRLLYSFPKSNDE